MNHRNVCIVGLAAVATVLAGCAAQYRNPSSCVDEMRGRLDGTSLGELKITNRAVSYRGQRVVIEGRLERASVPDAASAADGSAHAQTPASSVAGSEKMPADSTFATNPTVSAKPASAAQAASQPHPATPVGALIAHFAHPRKTTPTAAECTFDESGLTSFRWLAPAVLAKTTPAPARSE